MSPPSSSNRPELPTQFETVSETEAFLKKKGHSIRILPLGDSITIGYPDTYRYELFNRLSAAGYGFSFIGSQNDNPANYPGIWDMQHEGHSGWTTLDINAQLDHWLTGYHPDITLTHLGTNDVTYILEGALSMDKSELAMGSIIRKLRATNPDMTIYIARILPFTEASGPSFTKLNDLVNQWNIRLGNLVARLNNEASVLVLVDMNSGFGSNDFEDGVHPNRQGVEKMAQIWAKALLNEGV